jgi:two-component system response regulator DevR
MVALRPPPRRHLSSAFDRDNVGGPKKRPEKDAGHATATIVADLHPAFCAGVAQLLDNQRFSVVGRASTVAELKRLSASSPHVRLVLIGELPDGDVQAAVNALPEAARFVVFANEVDRGHVLRALELGASGYLLKSIRGEALTATLDAILAGGRADDESLAELVAGFIERRARSGYLVLATGRRVSVSPREQQVAHLLAEGASTRAISERLGISVVTVRRHVSALMRKLEVENRDGMISLFAA